MPAPKTAMPTLDHAPNLFALGISIAFREPSGAVLRFKRLEAGWLFDLSRHPKAPEELVAALAEISPPGLRRHRHDFYQESAREFLISADSLAQAKELLNELVVGFAALHHWGCGPLDGFENLRDGAGGDSPLSPQLLALRESHLLEASCETEASPKPSARL